MLLTAFQKNFVFIVLYLNKYHVVVFLNYIYLTVRNLIKNFFPKSSIFLRNSTKIYLQNTFLKIKILNGLTGS